MRRSGAVVDARVLEDFSGAFTVEARVDADHSPLNGPVVYRTGGMKFAGEAAPRSRGMSCTAVATGHESVTYEPCPLTDGDLGETFDPALDPRCPPDRDCPQRDTAVVVDLGRERPLELLVIRADDDVWIVDASTDGRAWRRVGTLQVRGGQAITRPSGDRRGRYVRIRARRWPLGSLTELSVW